VTSPLRIVIDARIPDGLHGGVQQWVIGLASALSMLEPADEQYLFLVERGHDQWLRPYLGGRCGLLRPRRPLVRRALGALWRPLAARWPALRRLRRGRTAPPPAALLRSDGTVERAGAHVVHFPMQTAFLTNVPSLYQPWDLQHLHLPEFFSEAQHASRELTYRAFCAQAAVVIAASNWVKRDLVEQYAIRPERVTVVNVPPVTAAYRAPTPEEIDHVARRLQLPDRFIFYPAQTWPHKNHGRLFEALAELRAEGLRVPLVCSGHLNEQYADVRLAADRLGLGADVRFLGFRDPLEVQVLYRRARALVFPSLYEGWGLPIAEAFLAGLPVACSNVTSLPDLVDDAALLFDPLDPAAIAAAIRRLWTDDQLAAELAGRGRSLIGRYDWHRTALAVRALYRKVGGRALAPDELELLAARPFV
jgi:glycosyltransferase involved in cell wall biosynthesis